MYASAFILALNTGKLRGLHRCVCVGAESSEMVAAVTVEKGPEAAICQDEQRLLGSPSDTVVAFVLVMKPQMICII